MGMTLAFPETKETCLSSKFSDGLSPNMCNSTHSTGAVNYLSFIFIFPKDGKPECQARIFVLIWSHFKP